MQKTTVIVPKGIRYIGNWGNFHLNNFPSKCIINKVIPGCGFTRYCIESPWENVILCSPRKVLLQNKYDQHKTIAYLVKNDLEQDPGVDMDLVKDKKVIDPVDTDKIYSTDLKAKLHQELREYTQSHVQHKILVTYDSFKVLKEVLIEMGIFQNFFVVIDEMQALMQDSRFKSSTEVEFLYHLQGSHSALFVSATPMLEEYLNELDEFKDLPYYELDWKTEDWTRIVKPNLTVKKMTSIPKEARKIIDRFKSGQYSSASMIESGQPVTKYATELVFYVNSVASIIRIIGSNGLKDSEVNILCSNTEDNQERIWKRLGGRKTGEYRIGRVPIEGEPRKPITLCTRTVYLGADFYSDCAESFIFSDPNSDYLSVDISQDLPQILGRQRCDSNPWKNSATLFYKTTTKDKKMSKEDFEAIIQKKKQATGNLLKSWNDGTQSQKDDLSAVFLDSIRVSHYSKNYVAVNRIKIGEDQEGKPIFNKVAVENHLVRVAEKRAFDIQQIDYADRFSVFTSISGQFSDGFVDGATDQDPIEFQVLEFFKVYDTMTRVSDRLKLLCEVQVTPEAKSVILNQLPDTDKVKYFYQAAGPERCRANSYVPNRISSELGIRFFSRVEISREIYGVFSINNRYSLTDIKSTLARLYQKIGYDKAPKATDLKEFFELKEAKITDPVTKKRIKGFELIRKLL